MEILEHDHQRLRRALRGDQLHETTPDLIRHQRRVLTRGPQLLVILVVELRTDHLAEEHGRESDRIGVARRARPQLLAAHLDRLAILNTRSPSQRWRDHSVR